MKLSDDIYSLFRQIAQKQSSIRLLNVYKGLPIFYDASIVDVSPPNVIISSNRYQIACLYIDRETIIVNEFLPGPVSAEVNQLNPTRLEARINNFELLEISVTERQQVRVEPAAPIRVTMHLPGSRNTVEATIADVSQNGLGIHLERPYFLPKIYTPNTDMVVSIYFPNLTIQTGPVRTQRPAPDPMSRFSRDAMRGLGSLGNSDSNEDKNRKAALNTTGSLPTTIKAVIRNIRPELSLNRVRLGMALRPDDNARAVIANYISLRQAELIREIKDIFDLLNKFQH